MKMTEQEQRVWAAAYALACLENARKNIGGKTAGESAANFAATAVEIMPERYRK